MKTILLAEDDSFIADIYSTHLQKAGYAVEIAKDGRQAVEKVRKLHPDLLILDVTMPILDGWQVLAEIRNDVSVKDTKAIVISNLDEQGNQENIATFGVVKYFLKVQTSPEEIVDTVNELLK